ncbi:DUF2812 domain-containing protein [Aerococcus urinae]
MMVTKFKAFFNPIEGRQEYLNTLADQAYRLLSSGGLLQRFQRSDTQPLHYTVQYIGHMVPKERKDYCKFLEGLGYQTFFAPLNMGKFTLGNVRWRPYNNGRAALATSLGMINHEILIIESKEAKELPAFSEKEGKRADLKGRLRPATYLMIVSLIMLGIALLVYLDFSQDWWAWTARSVRPLEGVFWVWLIVGAVLLIYSGWTIARIRSLIQDLS